MADCYIARGGWERENNRLIENTSPNLYGPKIWLVQQSSECDLGRVTPEQVTPLAALESQSGKVRCLCWSKEIRRQLNQRTTFLIESYDQRCRHLNLSSDHCERPGYRAREFGRDHRGNVVQPENGISPAKRFSFSASNASRHFVDQETCQLDLGAGSL
jgi:hypothetical protein